MTLCKIPVYNVTTDMGILPAWDYVTPCVIHFTLLIYMFRLTFLHILYYFICYIYCIVCCLFCFMLLWLPSKCFGLHTTYNKTMTCKLFPDVTGCCNYMVFTTWTVKKMEFSVKGPDPPSHFPK